MAQISLTLEQLARQTPDRVAVIDLHERIGYAELDHRVTRTAAWLHRQGLRPADCVGLTVREEMARLVSQLALLRLGCLSVTLASFEPVDARAELARRCGAVAVLADGPGPHPESLSVVRPDLQAVWKDSSLQAPGRALPMPASDTPAVVLTSSGTTGRPKLIVRSQAQLHGYDQPEWPVPAHSFPHIASPAESNVWTWGTLCNLVRSRTMVLADPARIPLAQACAQYGITNTFVWPARLAELVHDARRQNQDRPLASVCLRTGGTTVSTELQRDVLKLLSERLLVLYGATECGVATQVRSDPDHLDPQAVGLAIPGIEIAIVDDAGHRLPAGETGFIRIRCPWIATEYWRDEEATARSFFDGWWQPGDIGRLDGAGMLLMAGRGDDMLILNSINIFPAEIEAVAEVFEGVVECAAFPVASAHYGQIPLLAVVAAPGFDTAALMAHCRALLGVRSPRKVVLMERLPRNIAGKVLRRELTAAFTAG